MADSHVHRDEGLGNVLEDHAVEQLAAEVQAGGGSAYGTFVGCEDGLVVLDVFRSDFGLHPFRDVGLAKGEEGLLEVLVRAVEEEAQGAAAGSGVVDDFRHKRFIFTEVKLVADTDFTGGIHDYVPKALFAVQFAEQEDHDVGPCLFLFAVHAGGEDLCVVEDEGVSFAEVVYYVFEDPVLYFTAVFVEDHEAGFVSPTGGFLGNSVLRKIKTKLRKFHYTSISILL